MSDMNILELIFGINKANCKLGDFVKKQFNMHDCIAKHKKMVLGIYAWLYVRNLLLQCNQ